MLANDVSVVLVHGAWADGSSWRKVIRDLVEQGVRVAAAPLPLTSVPRTTSRRSIARWNGSMDRSCWLATPTPAR